MRQQHFRQILWLLIAVSVTFAAMGGILGAVEGLWVLYEATEVGQQYVRINGHPPLIMLLHAKGALAPALESTLVALGVTQLVAVVSHFLGVTSYLYNPFGWVVRITAWGLPIAALSGVVMAQMGLAGAIETGFWLALLPTVGLFGLCFRLSQSALPDLSILLAGFPRIGKGWDMLSGWLALVLFATAASIVGIYLLGLILEYQPFSPIASLWKTESVRWGRIPFDLSGGSLITLGATMTLIVFGVCLTLAVAGQLAGDLCGLNLLQPRPARTLAFVPILILSCGVAIRYIISIEPLYGAIVLGVPAVLCMQQPLIEHARDLIPGKRCCV